MRKVVASFFMSLDGVVEAPQTWHFPYFNEQMGAVIADAIGTTGAFLLGRRTYEEWAAYWPAQPQAENQMARAINTLPKHVASTTLREVAWDGATLLGGDLAGEVARLKHEPGGDLAVPGSATLVRSLLADGLVDELRLMIHPVVVGSGGRLFEGGAHPTELELVESDTFDTGVLNVTYRPVSR